MKFQRSAGQSVDHFVSVIARVVVALKNAVQSQELRFVIYDIVKKSGNRIENAYRRLPECCLRQQKHEISIQDLKRIQDNEDLPSMLGSSPGARPIALRPKARSLLEKVNDMKPTELDTTRRTGSSRTEEETLRCCQQKKCDSVICVTQHFPHNLIISSN